MKQHIKSKLIHQDEFFYEKAAESLKQMALDYMLI